MATITILPETTQDPISLIGKCAGVCYGTHIDDKQKNYTRGLSCIKSNHGRTLEYVDVYAVIDGYSARVIREWYTHIGGAPSRLQASTRYINYEDIDLYVPESISNNEEAFNTFNAAKQTIQLAYAKLITLGISKEDAANILPLGMTTKIMDKRNLRNIIDMSHQRLCARAYKEYRELMTAYLDALSQYSSEWATVVDMCMKPKCELFGHCTEEHSCGRKPKIVE